MVWTAVNSAPGATWVPVASDCSPSAVAIMVRLVMVRSVMRRPYDLNRLEVKRPRQDSNLRTRLRRPMLYPLSYEGGTPKVTGGDRGALRET